MALLNTKQVIATSGIVFGTSGARGLVEQFSPDVCAAFTLAFVASIKSQLSINSIAIAVDNRPSSYAMAKACAAALKQQGINVIYYGVIPTPALACAAMKRNISCIMVTGSHIPFDRNGLKFYRPDGEITKNDEHAILNNDTSYSSLKELSDLLVDNNAAEEYIDRYTSLFKQPFLKGKHIGIYEHSSAGRDLYQRLFEALGAEVTSLERSDVFVPIDTEAVSEEDQLKAKQWSKQYQFDAIFSTDGDGDRPLIADEKGNWLRGDILGLLCARQLAVEALAVPINCNTSIELSKTFKMVKRTQIGSPYVIAEFVRLCNEYHCVAGFEANGGFLLATNVEINNHLLTALPTRDAVLPVIMLLAATQGIRAISTLVEECALRFSASNRIKNFATEKSQQIINSYRNDPSILVQLLGFSGLTVDFVDITDGLRMTLSNNEIIHLRPSGNAPELRCYAESSSEVNARSLVAKVLSKIQEL